MTKENGSTSKPPSSDELTLSYSRIAAWLRCRQAYSYRHIQKLIPRVAAPALRRGKLIHSGIEAALLSITAKDGLNPRDVLEMKIIEDFAEWASHPALAEISDAIRDEAKQLALDCVSIANRAMEEFGVYDGRWETVYIDDKPLIEYTINEKVRGIKFTGTVDWVAKDTTTGYIWLIDWKSRKQLTPAESDEFNMQQGIYQALLHKRGLRLQGLCTGQIRAAVPAEPKRNKNGTFSRAKQATDWNTYKAAVLAAGMNPDDYEEMKDKLSEFQRLDFTFRTFKEVRGVWLDVERAILDIDNPSGLPIYRSMNSFNCRMCSYTDLCMEQLRGNDTLWLQKSKYMLEDETPLSWLEMTDEEETEDDD